MKKRKNVNIAKLKIPKIDKINLTDFDDYKSSINYSDRKEVIKNLVELFVSGDHETFFEILDLYIGHEGKRKISRETKIPERTIYNFITKDHETSSRNVFKIMKQISGGTPRNVRVLLK